MPVDDNPHRIFISDLDAAIAEIEAEEKAEERKQQEQAFLLPNDVDKEISSVPQHILQGKSGAPTPSHPDPSPSQALVLYKDPLSIFIPEEENAARKAVNEARQRLRAHHKQPDTSEGQQAQHHPRVEPLMHEHQDFGYPLGRQQPEWRHGSDTSVTSDPDADAMDIE